MPQDGTNINSIVKELRSQLIGGRIDKITQPEKDEIVIAIRSGGANHKLLLTSNATAPRLHLTKGQKPSPMQAPMFCMVLRKHIGGGRLLDIRQPGFERIVELHIEALNEMGDKSAKILLIEIMGRHSNIMLVNPAHTDAPAKIVDAIKHVPPSVSAVRAILPGGSYTRPPSGNKEDPLQANAETLVKKLYSTSTMTHLRGDFSQIEEVISPLAKKASKKLPTKSCGKSTAKAALAELNTASESLRDYSQPSDIIVQQALYQGYTGLSPVLASEICARANIAPDSYVKALTDNAIATLSTAFLQVFDLVKAGEYSPRIYYDQKDKAVDLTPLPFNIYSTLTPEEYDSPSVMQEAFYAKRDAISRTGQKTADLRKLVSTLQERCKKKSFMFEKTQADIKNRDDLRIKGELLTAYMHQVDRGAETVTLENFYDDNNPLEITISPNLTATENAQRYFKQYNKQKRTHTALQEQIKQNNEDIAYLDSIATAMETPLDESDISEIRAELSEQGFIKRKYARPTNKKAPKQAAAKPLHFTSKDGFDMYVGKNNTQNDQLTIRTAKNHDIWLHTKDIAGSHVIIITGGTTPPESTILEAANLAAYHSKARNSSSVPVDYVARRHVKKPNGAKPGFVIYDNHKTVYVTPVEV